MAVAYVTGSGSQNASNGTSLTYAVDCTGANYLIVFVNHRLNPGAETVTYNGVSMTQLNLTNAATNWQGMYGLANPTTGSNNVSASWANSVNVASVGLAFSGVGSTGTIDAAAVAAGSADYGPTITIGADDMLVGCSGVPDVPSQISVVTGTERVEAGTGTDAGINGATNTGSGSTQILWDYTSTGDVKTYIGIQLVGAATGTTRDARLLTLLGVG